MAENLSIVAFVFLLTFLLALLTFGHRSIYDFFIEFIKIQISLGFFKVVTERFATRNFESLVVGIAGVGIEFIDDHFYELSDLEKKERRDAVISFMSEKLEPGWERFGDKTTLLENAYQVAMDKWNPDKFFDKQKKKL